MFSRERWEMLRKQLDELTIQLAKINTSINRALFFLLWISLMVVLGVSSAVILLLFAVVVW